VDFSEFAGRDLVLHNNSATPFSGMERGNARPSHGRAGHPIGADLPEIMLFRVSAAAVADPSVIPAVLSPSFERLLESAATVIRDIPLVEVTNEEDVPLEALLNGKHWSDPISENRTFGSTEIWRFLNTTADSHPIHLHLDHFQVLGRQRFNAEAFESGQQLRLLGPRVPPAPEEAGWKDTVLAHPGEVTAIIVRSDSFQGVYPYHCHILEHEDNEMMLRFSVV
jgi:spore coat protein A